MGFEGYSVLASLYVQDQAQGFMMTLSILPEAWVSNSNASLMSMRDCTGGG